MRVFVTGASGFIGSATVKELLRTGHQVTGLARSDESAKAILALGAKVHMGSIYDLESLKRGAAESDGVIHLAFNHDFSKFQENCETDRKAIGALGSALEGTKRPLIVTSGSALLAGKPALETENPVAGVHPRMASEEAARELAKHGVHTSIVRLAPSVHGEGEHGFVPMLIALAREKGAAAYIGEGQNRWPGIHRLDAAVLYRLALEKGAEHGVYHGVAEEGVPFKEIARVIGKHLKVPVVSKSKEEAAAHFGWFSHFAGIDNPTSNAITREQLGWAPKQPGLIADLDHDYYFKS